MVQLNRAFLGLAKQLGSFMPDLAHATVEMRKLLKNDVAFVWLCTHEQEFKMVKDLLTSPALVKPFNPALPTELLTDASRLHGLGSALLQREWMGGPGLSSGKDHLIADALSRAPHFPPDKDGEVHFRRICSSDPALAVIYGAVDDIYLRLRDAISSGAKLEGTLSSYACFHGSLRVEAGLVLLGITKTYEQAQQLYAWPGLFNEVKNKMSACTRSIAALPSHTNEPLITCNSQWKWTSLRSSSQLHKYGPSHQSYLTGFLRSVSR
eukprot:TCALIF_12743-PA protein Name:"Protein of unknown function" AED:0.12 eAED:0.23 QI:0/0/0/0.8/0/0/5/0/265